jgi:ADP-L-glycero-D-manno-heptose 6-epimerase
MIVVTGGAGFIGSHLVAALVEKGHNVTVCDRLGQDQKWQNLAKPLLAGLIPPEYLFHYLDIRRHEIDVIFHMGAISSTTERDADLIIDTNFRLSQGLWQWCAENKKRFIYASSAATYGNGQNGFDDVEDGASLAKYRPLNAYGWSKHLFDRWRISQHEQHDMAPLQCVGLKFFNVYGPNEYHKGPQRSVVHQIFPYAVKKEPYALFKSHHPDYKDGGQLRDFIYVEDCINIMLWFLEHADCHGLYNVGTGKARSFADLAAAVYQAAGAKPKIIYRDMPEELRGQYQYFTEANMAKLRAVGYDKPMTTLEDGVQKYVQQFLLQDNPYR